MKKALITGITGQDGSYLADLLLEKGYEVHATVRRVAIEDPEHRLWRIRHILDKLVLHAASLESFASLFNVIDKVQPDEIYHLAAQSFVSYSFEDEFSTIGTNINGTHYVLAAMKERAPHARFYFAASSEMYGNAKETPQNENTAFHPRSPYGISKVAGFQLTENYRQAYNLYAVSGICFNHESPRRGFEFVSRKVTNTVARIKLGLAKELVLGNLESKRDWGYAADYVQAMWLMLQQDEPDDYVIATGESHSVTDLVQTAFQHVGLDYKKYTAIDERLYRPAEIYELRGDYTKARKKLNWQPTVTFERLIHMMVDSEIASLTAKGS
ncbi:MAG: GDP-mannose 4,6-dehydratase [Alphaproteobacteria bacterium]